MGLPAAEVSGAVIVKVITLLSWSATDAENSTGSPGMMPV